MKASKIFLVASLAIASCDPNSAVDTDEFVDSHIQFSKGSPIKRSTLYFYVYKDKEYYWSEAALGRRGKSITVLGEDAADLWKEVETEELSYKVHPVDPSPLNMALVFENSHGEKFQLILKEKAEKNGKLYIFGNRSGGDDWWFEAKSVCWIKNFGIESQPSR